MKYLFLLSYSVIFGCLVSFITYRWLQQLPALYQVTAAPIFIIFLSGVGVGIGLIGIWSKL